MKETIFLLFHSFFSFVFLFFGCLLLSSCVGEAANISYDGRAVLINGERRVLISGSIHYPRSTPQMWPDLIRKAKEGGLNVVDTYVFWNLHEPVENQIDFEGRKDLPKFLRTIASAGLYAFLRIGPYVCAEWNYGGFPIWLHMIPHIKFRTNNTIFEEKMENFAKTIVTMLKKEKLFASQGGPIILTQVENEYGRMEPIYRDSGKNYVKWIGTMVQRLGTGVPWTMSGQHDAPDNVIDTCDGFYCDRFLASTSKEPRMWTEAYTGWFRYFGGSVPHRPVEDIAYSVARFFQKGGTFVNHYMYHGGTNFGHSSGGPFISTTYDYDAPIDEYGVLRQPKWGHLKDLHNSLKRCEGALSADNSTNIRFSRDLEANVYNKSLRSCAAFLANNHIKNEVTVLFNGKKIHLPPWSVSILADCKNEIFNTAKVNSLSTRVEARPLAGIFEKNWTWVNEPVGITKKNAFKKVGLLEQIVTTADATDYLWYSISIEVHGNEPFLSDNHTTLHVETLGHGLHAFVNGKLAGTRVGNSNASNFTFEKPILLASGKNTIDLLSFTVGLQNSGAFFESKGAGITGPVKLIGKKGVLGLSTNEWTYQVGLKGEELELYKDPIGSSSLWLATAMPENQPLVWYKTKFDAPRGNDPIAIDFTGMGKGEAWVNGQSIGRYWPTSIAPPDGCENTCTYRGTFSINKCLTGCGSPSQTLYHVPREWILPTNNTLVLFEEMGGDPTKIQFAKRQVLSVCAHVSELHPTPMDSWGSDLKTGHKSGPTLQLKCPSPNGIISKIKFASFGTPQGTCGSYSIGECNTSYRAIAIAQQACVGSNNCSIGVSTGIFGDPCKGVIKSLAVEAICT